MWQGPREGKKMPYFESILLGLVQGLGEFLPISSSAHLVILPWISKFKDPGLAFDVALHLGTLFAVVGYFWREWVELFVAAAKSVSMCRRADVSTLEKPKLLLCLVVATVPAALAGALLNDWAESTLRHPLLVAGCMVGLGAVLLWVDSVAKHVKSLNNMTVPLALLIGLAQCLALLPGVSRSGITITMALALGFSRSESARFSFLLSTPIIFGACLFKYKYFLTVFTDSHLLVGVTTAAVFGFLSIKFLMKLVQNYSYAVFAYYRFVFGAVVIVIYFLR